MELSHHRRGQGPTLVLVHGIGSQWQVWSPVLDRLAARRDVIAVDLPGFGESAPLPSGVSPTIDAQADALLDFLGGLGVDRPHVCGNSMGGWIALELARRGAVASACALSPAGFWNRREAAYSRASLRLAVKGARSLGSLGPRLAAHAAGRTLLLGQVVAKPWRLTPDDVVGALGALARAPAFDEALSIITAHDFAGGSDIDVPTTIAWGEKDRLLIPRQARRAARALPQARVLTLRGCGHVPTWDDPEQVARVVLEASGDGAG